MSQVVTNSYRYAGSTVFQSNSYINDNATTAGAGWFGSAFTNGVSITSGSQLIGLKPSSVIWEVVKVGSPSSGNLVCRIYNSSFVVKATSTNTIAASGVSDKQDIEFSFAGTYALASTDVVALAITSTSGSDSSNYVSFYRSSFDESAVFTFVEPIAGLSGWVGFDPLCPYLQITG